MDDSTENARPDDPDLVALNFHLPNCECVVLDGGRVDLSEDCAFWTKVMHRWHDDAVKRARHGCDTDRCCRDCGLHSSPHKGCILR